MFLQNETAVGRIATILTEVVGQNYPDAVMDAYLAFECMSEHDLSFVCILCGYHPHILVLDANRKVAFSVSGICQFLKYYQLTHVLLCRPSMDLYLASLVVGLPCGLIPSLDQGKHVAHIFIIGPLEMSAKTAETVSLCVLNLGN